MALLLQGGVSIKVDCGDGDLPSLSRALGCRVSNDRRTVVIFFSAESSPSLFAQLRDHGAISVALMVPAFHQTIHLKGRDVRFAAVASGDPARIEMCRKAFVSEMVEMGHREEFARSFAPEARSDVVAMSFTPTAVTKYETAILSGSPMREIA